MSHLVLIDMRAPHAEDLALAASLNGWRVVQVAAHEDMHTVAGRGVAAVGGIPVVELRLMGHGAPGEMQLGMGLTEHSAHDLAPLRAHMRGGLLGSVWCFACSAGAAAGPDKWHKSAILESGFGGAAGITAGRGYRLLRTLAATLGSSAWAPVETQFLSGWNHRDFFNGGIQFRGTSLEVSPDGGHRVHMADGSLREASQAA